MKKNCFYCGKDFESSDNDFENSFCSTQCYSDYTDELNDVPVSREDGGMSKNATKFGKPRTVSNIISNFKGVGA